MNLNPKIPVPSSITLCIGFVVIGGAYVVATMFAPQIKTATEPLNSIRPEASLQASASTVPPFVSTTSATPSPVSATSASPEIGLRAVANTVAASASSGDFQSSSTWATFTDPEDFYSVQYPDLGTLVVRYSPLPLKTILGWKGNGQFDVAIRSINSEGGLHLSGWLMKAHGIDVSHPKANVERVTINGMEGVLVFTPTGGTIIAYLEQDFFGEPLIHEIEFTSYLPGIDYPPFWRTMLSTFRGLPLQF